MQRTFNPPFYSTIAIARPDRVHAPGRRTRRDRGAMRDLETSQRTNTDFVRDFVVALSKLSSAFATRPALCSVGSVACIRQSEVCTGKFSGETSCRLQSMPPHASHGGAFAVRLQKTTVGTPLPRHLTLRCQCCRVCAAAQADLLNLRSAAPAKRSLHRTPKAERTPSSNCDPRRHQIQTATREFKKGQRANDVSLKQQ
jgi:hypothetical protein